MESMPYSQNIGNYDGVYLDIEQSHDGAFGKIKNADGINALQSKYGLAVVDINNSNCYYTSAFKGGDIEQSHDGAFGKIKNADGINALQSKYGLAVVDINNSNCYYTSAFKGGASSGGPGQSVSSQAVEDSTQPQSNGQSGSSNKGGSSKFDNVVTGGVDKNIAAEIAAGMRGGDYN